MTVRGLPGTLRGNFCTEAHRDEHKRAGWRKRKRDQREREADSILGGVVAASDGRSAPGWGADALTPPTQHHPSKRFARRHEPELVDYTEAGATERGSMHQRPGPRTDLQRFRPPVIDDTPWTPEDDEGFPEPYRFGYRFTNDMSSADPYSGYVSAGNPQAFVVKRASR